MHRAQRSLAAPPAPGYRSRDTGTLYHVGNYGYSYSSLVSSSNAHDLSFRDSWINPQHYDPHAYGFQVRCLLE